MPVFSVDGAFFIVHLLGRGHDDLRGSSEPKQAQRASENIIHGKGMKGGNKKLIHDVSPDFSIFPYHSTVTSKKQMKEPLAKYAGMW